MGVVLAGLAAAVVGTGALAENDTDTEERNRQEEPSGSAEETAEAGTVRVELNKLEPEQESCRIYLLLHNGTDTPFHKLEFDVVVFDPDGIVARRLALETAPLPSGKTRIKVFDLTELNCDAVGRFLLNSVLSCAGPDGQREGCMDAVRVSSKARAPLIK